ncbi:hypothetical protein WA026_009133 [Henosepilachna vigintioctopunctata]|uniref:Uncharacterized protein n=1 Tax=Henosepilachna vigintioctopunctata TaxID=420089 RepID=A0AAW1UUY0_9CUCU
MWDEQLSINTNAIGNVDEYIKFGHEFRVDKQCQKSEILWSIYESCAAFRKLGLILKYNLNKHKMVRNNKPHKEQPAPPMVYTTSYENRKLLRVSLIDHIRTQDIRIES